ncbi:hypothetical protein [Flavobacterium psychrotrophum]|uniref:hypothetical protein n=1 Tax=Flavobacterium psychrotrophum TaxID=2294119 RepID=UPI0013C44338|nr:hypothetical protein [Flavobacterium psychrotrophum]
MRKKLLILAAASLLISCQKEKQEPATLTEPEKTTAIPEMPALLLTSFTDVPSEIDGCSCLFSSDSLDFKNNRYLYANDFAEIAFMKINGTMVKFKQVSHQEKDSLSAFTTYRAKDLEMSIETRQTRKINYEVMEETGTITVKRSDGQAITKTVYGVCGC